MTYLAGWNPYPGWAFFYKGSGYKTTYDDNTYDVISKREYTCFLDGSSGFYEGEGLRVDGYRYGRFGNVLEHWVEKERGVEPQEKDVYEYWTEDKYFQKKSVTDMNGYVTTFDYGDRYGPPGERGNLLWVQDARHQPNGTAFSYTYNDYGQKLTETNLNGIVTQFTYGDSWGNLT